MQRLRSVAYAGPTHANYRQAVAELGERGRHEGLLFEVQRLYDS